MSLRSIYHVYSFSAILDNTVTFNKIGASTKLPLTFSETPVDLSFQFRTGIRRAYLIHAQGMTDPQDGSIANALAIRLSGNCLWCIKRIKIYFMLSNVFWKFLNLVKPPRRSACFPYSFFGLLACSLLSY